MLNAPSSWIHSRWSLTPISARTIIRRDATTKPSLSFARPSKWSGVFILPGTILVRPSAKGQLPEAIAEYGKAELDDDPFALALLGQRMLERAKGGSEKDPGPTERSSEDTLCGRLRIGLVYLGLGDKERAMDWLERAYQEHDGNDISNIRVDPLLAALRGDPRFEALAEKIVPAHEFKSQTASK